MRTVAIAALVALAAVSAFLLDWNGRERQTHEVPSLELKDALARWDYFQAVTDLFSGARRSRRSRLFRAHVDALQHRRRSASPALTQSGTGYIFRATGRFTFLCGRIAHSPERTAALRREVLAILIDVHRDLDVFASVDSSFAAAEEGIITGPEGELTLRTHWATADATDAFNPSLDGTTFFAGTATQLPDSYGSPFSRVLIVDYEVTFRPQEPASARQNPLRLCRALRGYPYPYSYDPMKDLYHEDADRRICAAIYLRTHRDRYPRVTQRLLKLIPREKDEAVLPFLFRALDGQGGRELLLDLLDLLAHERSEIWFNAADTLLRNRFDWHAAVFRHHIQSLPPEQQDRLRQLLIAWLGSPDWQQRRTAATQLMQRGICDEAKAIDAVMLSVDREIDERCWDDMLSPIAQCPPETLQPIADRLIDSPLPVVWYWAAPRVSSALRRPPDPTETELPRLRRRWMRIVVATGEPEDVRAAFVLFPDELPELLRSLVNSDVQRHTPLLFARTCELVAMLDLIEAIPPLVRTLLNARRYGLLTGDNTAAIAAVRCINHLTDRNFGQAGGDVDSVQPGFVTPGTVRSLAAALHREELTALAIARRNAQEAQAPPMPWRRGPVHVQTSTQDLPPGAVRRLGTPGFHYADAAHAVAVSPDGGTAVVAGERGIFNFRGRTSWATRRNVPIVFWDLQRGRVTRELTGYWSTVTALAFSPDGTRLAAGGDEVHVWELDGWKELFFDAENYERPQFNVNDVAFAPDGRRLALAGRDGRIILSDVEGGKVRAALQTHQGEATTVAFSPDGKLLASGGRDGVIVLRDAAALTEKHRLQHPTMVLDLRFGPRGRLLASGAWGSTGRTLRLWDVQSGKQTADIPAASDLVQALAFSPDGQLIAAEADNFRIGLWETAGGKLTQRLAGHSASVESLAFTPDGRTLVSAAGTDQSVRLWDLATGKQRPTGTGHAGAVTWLAFSPDGSRLFSAARDNSVRAWTLEAEAPPALLDRCEHAVTAAALAPDGKLIAAGDGRRVRLLDPDGKRKPRQLPPHDGQITALAFSADGKLLATGGKDKTVRLWNPETGKALATFSDHTAGVLSLAFAPEGAILASGGRDNRAILYDCAEQRLYRKLARLDDWVTDLAFAHDPHVLITADYDGRLQQFHVLYGRPLRQMQTDYDWVRPLAVSPDRRLAALAGGFARTIEIWDLQRQERLLTLPGMGCWIRSLAFSPDGRTLASGGDDTTILLWNIADLLQDAAHKKTQQP